MGQYVQPLLQTTVT